MSLLLLLCLVGNEFPLAGTCITEEYWGTRGSSPGIRPLLVQINHNKHC